jgi:hypothetical protein
MIRTVAECKLFLDGSQIEDLKPMDRELRVLGIRTARGDY